MRIRKAVITAASPTQRTIPLQTLVGQDRTPKPVLAFLLEEIAQAGIEDICCIVYPGDERRYSEAVAPYHSRVQFVPQADQAAGYAGAILSARGFLSGEPFLHLVGDHLYVNRPGDNCTSALLQLAESEDCSVSLVQPTRETLLPYFGCVGGRRVTGKPGVYKIGNVLEKPTPTEAEQKIMVPGLRAGYYLCFFGMHAFTPTVFQLLEGLSKSQGKTALSDALSELSRHEQYLALECNESRYDIGSRYGFMFAQMALALSGVDRDDILIQTIELFATRDLTSR